MHYKTKYIQSYKDGQIYRLSMEVKSIAQLQGRYTLI